ncbi:uncharacterized protein [Periplaneta americana]|uniref:uncharacterized protein isoform X1 n=1 Tax=Periplaneta americana TaxID=6978 RepID=UPI0037E876CE
MIGLSKGVTWLVILSCVVALAVAAPVSSEDSSSSSSEESTTISASTLPGQVPQNPQITAVKTKRDAQGDTPVSSVDKQTLIRPAIPPASTTSNPAGTTAQSLQKRDAQGDSSVSSADKQTLLSPAIPPSSTTSNPAGTTTMSLQKRDAQGDYPVSSTDKQTLLSPAVTTATTTSNPTVTTTKSLQKRDAQGDYPVSSADKQSLLSPAVTTATTTSNPAVTTTQSLQKRQTETQTTVKPQADSVSSGSLTNPASPADSSSRVARTGEAQKPEPGTLPPDSPDNVQFTPKAKRDVDDTTTAAATTTPAVTTTKIYQKRGTDAQEPVAVSKVSEPKTVLTPPDVSTTPNSRSARDVEGLGQPERYAYKTPTASPQKDEKQSLSTIPEVPQERSKRAASPQGFNSRNPGRPGDFGRPQPGRPLPGKPPGRPGPPPPPPGRPGNRPGFPPGRPGFGGRP